MKAISFLPPVGPYYLIDLLSILSSIDFWQSADVVLDEKLIFKMIYFSIGS